MEPDPESDSNVEVHPTERSEFFDRDQSSEERGLEEELAEEERHYDELNQQADAEALDERIAAQVDAQMEEDSMSSIEDEGVGKAKRSKKPKHNGKIRTRAGTAAESKKPISVYRAHRDRYKRKNQRRRLNKDDSDGYAVTILSSATDSDDSTAERIDRLRRMGSLYTMSFAEREWANSYMTLLHQVSPHEMRSLSYMPLRAQETGGSDPYYVENRWYEDLSQYSIFQHSVFAYWPPKFHPQRFETYRRAESRYVDTPNPFEENLVYNTSTCLAVPAKITRGSQVVFEAPQGLDLLFYGQELFTRAKIPFAPLAIRDSDDEREPPTVRSLLPDRGQCPDLDVRRLGLVDDAYGGSASLGGNTSAYYAPEITDEDLELLREFEQGDRKKGKVVNMPEPCTLLERTIKQSLPAAHEAFNITPMVNQDCTESLGEYAVLMESAHVIIQDMWQKLVDHHTRVERQRRRLARQQPASPSSPPASPLPADEVVEQLNTASPARPSASATSATPSSPKPRPSSPGTTDSESSVLSVRSSRSHSSQASKHSQSSKPGSNKASGDDQANPSDAAPVSDDGHLPSGFGAPIDTEVTSDPQSDYGNESIAERRSARLNEAMLSGVSTDSSSSRVSSPSSSSSSASPVQSEVEKMVTDAERVSDIDDQAPDTSFMVTDAEEASIATEVVNVPRAWEQSTLAQAPEEDENLWLQRLTSVISDSYWPLTVPVGKNESLIVNETVHSLQATEGVDQESWVGQDDVFAHMDAVPFGIDTIQPIEQMDAAESVPEITWINPRTMHISRYTPTVPPPPTLPLFELSDLRPLSRPFTVSRVTHELAVSDLIEWLDEMLNGLLKHAAAVNVDRRIDVPSHLHLGLYTRAYHAVLDELMGVEHDRELRFLMQRKIRLIYDNYGFQRLWPTGRHDGFTNFSYRYYLHPLQQLVDAKYGKVGTYAWRTASWTDTSKVRVTKRAQALMKGSESEADSERTHAKRGRIKVDYDMIVNSFHRNHSSNRRSIGAKIDAQAERFRADPSAAASSPQHSPRHHAQKWELLRAKRLREAGEEPGQRTPTGAFSGDEEIARILSEFSSAPVHPMLANTATSPNASQLNELDPTSIMATDPAAAEALPAFPLKIRKKLGRPPKPKPPIGENVERKKLGRPPKPKPPPVIKERKKPGRKPKPKPPPTPPSDELEEDDAPRVPLPRVLPSFDYLIPVDDDDSDVVITQAPRFHSSTAAHVQPPTRLANARPPPPTRGKRPHGVGGKALLGGARKAPPKRKNAAPVQDDPDFYEDGRAPSPKRVAERYPKRARTVRAAPGTPPSPQPTRPSAWSASPPMRAQETPQPSPQRLPPRSPSIHRSSPPQLPSQSPPRATTTIITPPRGTISSRIAKAFGKSAPLNPPPKP